MLLDIKKAKPIIKWAKGKSGLLTQFEKLFLQTCTRYIKPFLGGGAVSTFPASKSATRRSSLTEELND
ncbi:MAG: hypothetical protein SFU25_06425 [Candidatus Caenarcaniphilales bacterium]|nr:hypothetical protein [Candidatus Caenarcaniphilales bacterium]